MPIKRRDFLKLVGTTLFVGAAATTSTILLKNQSQELSVERITIPISGLPPSFEGFRLVQMADFHLYPLTSLELVQEAVKIANNLRPDLIVLTGDYVWHDVEAIFDLAPTLAKLNAGKGVYSILGNHEIWTNIEAINTAFAENQLPLLINQGLTLSKGKGTIYLAGVDDCWSGQPDLATALEGCPTDTCVILLAHEPDLADDFAQYNRVALQLSGHSHGGQIRFPVVGALITPYLSWKYEMGLYRVKDMWLYTNRGIGVTNLPVRFNCPPEITEITLVSAGDL